MLRKPPLRRMLLCLSLALLTGCSWGTLTEEEFEARFPLFYKKQLNPFFFSQSIAEMREAFTALLGSPVQALELYIYPSYVVLEARDPNRKALIGHYVFRDGEIDQSGSSPASHEGPTLEARLFSLEEVALDKIPALVKQAEQEARQKEGEVSLITIKRESEGILTIVVDWDSPSGPGGDMEFNAQGLPL